MWTTIEQSREHGYKVRKWSGVYIAERFMYGIWHRLDGIYFTKQEALTKCFDLHNEEYKPQA